MFCCSCNVESLSYFGSIFLSAAEVCNSAHHSANNSAKAAGRETTGPSFIYNAFVNHSQRSICLFCKSIKLFIHVQFRRHSNPFKSHLHGTKNMENGRGGTEGFQEGFFSVIPPTEKSNRKREAKEATPPHPCWLRFALPSLLSTEQIFFFITCPLCCALNRKRLCLPLLPAVQDHWVELTRIYSNPRHQSSPCSSPILGSAGHHTNSKCSRKENTLICNGKRKKEEGNTFFKTLT